MKTTEVIRSKRILDVVEWWNARVDFMEQIIEAAEDPIQEHFKWAQLVWQEIVMWIQIGKEIEADDMEFICDRRGFSAVQRQTLKDAMAHVGLWHEECRGGGTADAPVSGTGGVTPVRVRIPPPAQYVVVDATEMEFDAFVEAIEDSQ